MGKKMKFGPQKSRKSPKKCQKGKKSKNPSPQIFLNSFKYIMLKFEGPISKTVGGDSF